MSNAVDIDLTPPEKSGRFALARYLIRNFSILRVLLQDGATGTFTTTDGKTVTVTKGVITNIV